MFPGISVCVLSTDPDLVTDTDDFDGKIMESGSDDLLCGVTLSRHTIPLVVSQILTLELGHIPGGQVNYTLYVMEITSNFFNYVIYYD